MNTKLLLLMTLPFITSITFSDTWVPNNTHVTQVATAQLFKQNAVIFILDKGTADCAAGSYVYYRSTNIDELKVTYASVLAAQLSGTPVLVHFPTVGCTTDTFGVGN